jgi:hypothetical protein
MVCKKLFVKTVPRYNQNPFHVAFITLSSLRRAKNYLLSYIVKRCRSKPVPVGGRGNVQEDRKGGPRLVSRIEEGYVRDISSESDLPIVQIVESGLIFQL